MAIMIREKCKECQKTDHKARHCQLKKKGGRNKESHKYPVIHRQKSASNGYTEARVRYFSLAYTSMRLKILNYFSGLFVLP